MHLNYSKDFILTDKRVLLRLDLNTPVEGGEVVNDERIIRSLPTINYILQKGGKLKIISHLGRPKETKKDQPEFSLDPVAKKLSQLLDIPVPLIPDLDNTENPNSGSLILYENIRFFAGEKENNKSLSKKLGSLCDIFVMDAFATSHRAHSSTTGVVHYAPNSCIGFLVEEELAVLSKLRASSIKPSLAILGGAKISTKLELINELSSQMDFVLLGGGIANTCFAAQGYSIGNSLIEGNMLDEARELVSKKNVILPNKVVVSNSVDGNPRITDLQSINDNEAIFDIAPDIVNELESIFRESKIILWNGPMGLFEKEQFMDGTKSIAELIISSSAYSVAGGGDTISAASKLGILNSFDYVSTAGGAFLEYIEGRNLPALEALQLKALE